MEHLQDLFTLWIGDSLLPADNQQTACKMQVVLVFFPFKPRSALCCVSALSCISKKSLLRGFS